MDIKNQVSADGPASQPVHRAWYKHKGILAIAILTVIAAAAIGAYGALRKNGDAEGNLENDETSPLAVPSDWKDYQNDVLGLSFKYSPAWGNMATWPNGQITNLATLGQDNNFTPNSYLNYIRLSFSEPGPVVKMYSDAYGGETYLSPPYGPVDNVTALQPSDSACAYKVEYRHGDSLEEIYTDCKNGIKVSVVEQVQHFNPASFADDSNMPPSGILYTYSLNYYGYKHLQNGSFDRLLASYTATSTMQQASRLTADAFLQQAGADQGNYPSFSEFDMFFWNIEVYAPRNPENPVFEVPAGEDENVTLIRKYYYLLVTGQLTDAYALLSGPTDSPKEFQERNRNIYKAVPHDIKRLTNDAYEFWLDFQQHNAQPQQQRLVVEVVNGRLKQDLSETLTSPIAAFRDFISYGASRGDKSIVVLKQGDSESIIDSAPNDFDRTLATLIFESVAFSPKGSYVSYVAGGWEWAYMRVYDIARRKHVLETENSGQGEFNPSESLYFFCSNGGMSGDIEGKVYRAPEFTVKLDLLQKFPDLADYTNVDCSSDLQNHTVQFRFAGVYDENQNYDETVHEIHAVNLDTGELVN